MTKSTTVIIFKNDKLIYLFSNDDIDRFMLLFILFIIIDVIPHIDLIWI